MYTGEEAVVVLRDKMTRLRDLYRDQFKYLTGVLHEEQRRYLRTVKPEHDALGQCRFFYTLTHTYIYIYIYTISKVFNTPLSV